MIAHWSTVIVNALFGIKKQALEFKRAPLQDDCIKMELSIVN
jgi:hypothetical protein